MTLALLLLAVAALILLNAYFVAAEYALVTARRTRLQELANEGHRRARLVLTIQRSAAIHRGDAARRHRTPAWVSARSARPALPRRMFDSVDGDGARLVLAYLILTFFHVVIGELMPKGVALAHSERVALAVAAPVRGFFVDLQAADLGAAALERRRRCAGSGSSRRRAR